MKPHPLKTTRIKRAQALGLKRFSNPLNPNSKDDLRWIANEIATAKAINPATRFAIVRHDTVTVCLWRDNLQFSDGRIRAQVNAGPTNCKWK